jgi:signal transduction histidine kinase
MANPSRHASRRRWLAAGAQVLALELVVLLGTFFTARFHPHSRPLDAVAIGLAVLAAGAIGLSGRSPVAGVGVALACVLVYHAIGYQPAAIDLALMVALYKAASPQRLRLSVMLGAIAVLGYAIVSALGPGGLSLEAPLIGTLAVLASLGLGYAVAGQRAYRQQRREEETQHRLTEERFRIARELHDVVSHSISTINVQAAVAAHVMAERPEQAHAALLAIKETSRDTLRELRGILQVLRRVDEDEPREPAPGLGQLEILIDTAIRAGVPTSGSVIGPVRPLSPAIDLAAYRIIQESLTNVIRHAAPASATVTVAYEPAQLVIEVRDDGRGGAAGTAGTEEPGHGLAGMRERVNAVGGELEAIPMPGRGFRVRASLPTDEPSL